MGTWNKRQQSPPEGPAGSGYCLGVSGLDVEGAHAAALLDTVEHQIIPRLMLLHRQRDVQASVAGPAPSGVGPVSDEVIEHFAEAVLRSYDQAQTQMHTLLEAGVPAPQLCLGLLAPAARRLGDWWLADRCDFTQVTIGLGRLQGLLRELAERLPPSSARGLAPRCGLFLPAPGEQHTLGLSMVRDFFRAAGWEVCAEEPDGEAEVLALVRRRAFDVVGFSIGSERQMPALATLIARVRSSARGQPVLLLGGPLVSSIDNLAQCLGADACAQDAQEAIFVADTLVSERDHTR